jgi:hypothetical protein
VIPAICLEFFAIMMPAPLFPKLEYEYFGKKAVLVNGLVKYERAQ